jgi:hypothetical protein
MVSKKLTTLLVMKLEINYFVKLRLDFPERYQVVRYWLDSAAMNLAR